MFHISLTPLTTGTILTPGVWGQKTEQFYRTNYPQYIKEEIFEEVRRTLFPQAPSRLSSVFLFPDSTSAYFYRANCSKYKAFIYKMKIISGEPFVAEMDLLNCNGEQYAHIKSCAEKYWRQVQHVSSQTLEVILNGQARVSNLVIQPSVI